MTGFDDGIAQVRNIRDPDQPTAHEHQEHMTTHRPYSSWCKFFLCRSDAQDDLEGVPHVSLDYGFHGEEGERGLKITWVMLVPRKGTEFPWIAKRAAKFIDQLGRLRHWRGKSLKLAKKDARPCHW